MGFFPFIYEARASQISEKSSLYNDTTLFKYLTTSGDRIEKGQFDDSVGFSGWKINFYDSTTCDEFVEKTNNQKNVLLKW